ncbi:MAG: DegQ family serine endoprotease [Chlamydiales bacterium]|nr:DegQ family serine endoprotease [Chlamydiales bacterium]
MPFKKLCALSITSLILFTPAYSAEGDKKETSHTNETLLKQISKGFSTVAKKATPAVVYIEAQAEKTQKLPRNRGLFENPFDHFNDDFFNRFFGFPYQERPAPKKQETVRGSGFIVSENGYIVTNNHVVENAAKVNVTFNNGKKYTAKVVGTDPKTDLAVIKIDEKKLPYLSFADSETLEVGDWAIAIGNPFGLQATVTVGVVSAKGRSQLHIADFEDFIQTDAAINPGNSGGPLLDIEGEVIGVNTAIVSGSGGYMGIGFAIPSNMAMRIIEQLIKDGEVTRGFLGVTLQQIDADLATFYKLKTPNGALVTDVIKGSPADTAGLKQEDIIIRYNGTPVESLSAFRNYVSLLAPGSKLNLHVNRDGREREMTVVISTVPEEVKLGSQTQKLGLKVENMNAELAQKLNFFGNEGVVITQVEPGSPADEAALRPGSVIIAVNRRKVTSVEDFSQAIHESSKEEMVLLMVRQGDAVRFVTLHLDD